MSGGRIAISGFDYQAIVILAQLFDHFDQHGPSACARPEGADDLDLTWLESGRDRRRHLQVKKPRETAQGIVKPRPWRLAEAASELLPNTLSQLAGTQAEQVWVLGDLVQPEVRRLVQAGLRAARDEADSYWRAVHLLARAAVLDQAPVGARQKLMQWRPSPSMSTGKPRDLLVSHFGVALQSAGCDAAVVRSYERQVEWVNRHLPSVLARLTILDDYGSEAEVGQRFKDRLRREYGLAPDVVEHTLFANFRTFINDVAKEPNRTIDRQGFEIQLRSAWPQMSAATEPPVPPVKGIVRSDLLSRLIGPGAATATEIIGLSGSGKTTLAAQTAAALNDVEPACLPLYVRVRANEAFRDVMAGVAFHLLRRGAPELFGLAVDRQSADETAIERLAEICSGLTRPVQLLFDLAEGSGNAQFGQDLGRFARALTPGSCRLSVFGQQSTFRTFSPIEIESADIVSISLRGFDWEEFARLVILHHPTVDRAALHGVFQRVTAGRTAGLPAQLADALARQASLDMMRTIAERSPEDMVSAAEQARFDQLAPAARPAAERLVCIALPFSKRDAESIFPNENVGAAIKALFDLGLLQAGGDGLLEMHEIVRAGLEAGIAPTVRVSGHTALATWYAGRGDIAAQIFHLEKAGEEALAHRLGRDAFLRGEAWRSLASYVTRHALVKVGEVVEVAASAKTIDDFYYLKPVLAALDPSEGADSLMAVLKRQTTRYFTDSNWARPIVEAILAGKSVHLGALLELTVHQASDDEQRRQGLSWILIALRWQPSAPSLTIVEFTKSQSAAVQPLLLPLLFANGARAALVLAFGIYARATGEEARRAARWNGLQLKIDSSQDVAEILAALPAMTRPKTAEAPSLGFGALEPLFWAARHRLRPVCRDLLQAEESDAATKAAAWRVLILAGEQDLEALVDPLAPGDIPPNVLLLGPTFAPAAYDEKRYEAVLLDTAQQGTRRQAALNVLLALNADLGALRDRLAALASDPLARLWDGLFVLLFIKQPFAAGVPLLRAELRTPTTTLPERLLSASLLSVGEATWPGVTDLLLDGIQHPDPGVRRISATALARQRLRAASEHLGRGLRVESEWDIAVLLAQALTASGPTSAAALAGGVPSNDLELWRCIVAMRSRDQGFGPRLITLAIDPATHWVVRRAAIWAAGRLPFDAALEAIAPTILQARSPLTVDVGQDLHAHSAVSDMLQNGVADFLRDGEAGFVKAIASALSERWSELLHQADLPPSADVARWLYGQLARDPSPGGVQHLLNAIATPLLQAAVVRSFRMCGCPQDIEHALAATPSVWLAVKCLLERRWVGDEDPDLVSRLRQAVAMSPCHGTALLDRIIDETDVGRRRTSDAAATSPAVAPDPSKVCAPLDYASVVGALRGGERLAIAADRPVVLKPLDRAELQRLIALADPANDPVYGVVRYVPVMAFTREGHTVGQQQTTTTGGSSDPERLRPAIAAANRFDLPMPWHEERMRWPWGDRYGAQFLASLGAQGDGARFYDALEADVGRLLPLLAKGEVLNAAAALLDDRLARPLRQCLWLGDDELLETLCGLVSRISSPTAVPLLSGLLQRWAAQFDLKSFALQGESHTLWRGFTQLTSHPRFAEVEGWRRTLENVLRANIRWFHKDQIARVLATHPGSYVAIEARLAREENWVHFNRSEIDVLDSEAERLFHETR